MLNQIPGYHVTSNYSLDMMHTILEGIVPVELLCVLYALCHDSAKSRSLEHLSERIRIFWGVINVDRCNQPPVLNAIDKPSKLLPSMKAVQLWSLLKYLPLIWGDIVDADNKHWEFLLHLSHLVDIIYAPVFTTGMVAYLTDLIAEHLNMFKNIYSSGDNAVSLKPKHHLLVHLPSVIVQSGPLVDMNTMRYELKNSFFKRCAHVMSNFRNMSHTDSSASAVCSVF